MTENAPGHQELAEDEARRWIARMASAEMSASELAAFKTWRAADPAHNRAFEEQRAIWRAAGESPLLAYGPNRTRTSSRRHWRWSPSRQGLRVPRPLAASSVAAALIGALVFGPDIAVMVRADHRTSIAVESVNLPDGSRAMLDAGSAIAISYTDGERRVELLCGDAWFEVSHGDSRPFRVAALGGMTQDVGTAFEVRRTDDAVSVAVTQGAVEVHAREDSDGLLLRAAQRARYGKGGPAIRLDAADSANIASWRRGEILLAKATVGDAIARIKRYRSAPVIVMGEPTDARRISGVFRVDRPDEAIDAVARMARLTTYRLGAITILRPTD